MTKGSNVTRRSFLKTAGACAGVAAGSGVLAGAAPLADAASAAQAAGDTREVLCACTGNCDNDMCPVWVTVKDGKAVNIRRFYYDDDRDEIHHQQHNCLRCYDNLERMYSDQRIKTPLRRTGERGSGQFEAISWDEAIKEICDNFKRIADEWGPESIYFFYSSGFNNDKTVQYSRRLCNYMHATANGANLDMNGQFTLPQRVGKTKYVMRGDDYRRMRSAKNVFLWGTNPAESMMVSYHNITKAQENGATIVCIDPIYTLTAQHADKWIPVRPGSDGLLAMAMLQIIMRDGKIDEAYLREKTVAPFLVKASDGHFLRKSDLGQVPAGADDDAILVMEGGATVEADASTAATLEGTFTVEGHEVTTAYSLLRERIDAVDLADVAEKTDVSLDDIEWLAATYADGPSWMQPGFGVDHYANGYTFYEVLIAMAAATGNMTKEGAGITITDSEIDALCFHLENLPLDDDGNDVTEVPGKIYEIWKNKGIPGIYEHPVKALYPIGANIVHNTTERGKTIEMLRDLEFVVTQDFEMTETCMWADIVLPACFHFEREMIGVNGSDYLRYTERAIDPQFESKNDIDIWNLIAEGMGLGEHFGYSLDDLFRIGLDNDEARQFGITLDALKENRVMFANPDPIYKLGEKPFATATGRIEFYQEDLKPQADWHQPDWDWRHETLPYWEPPREAWPENELFKKYPIVFLSPHNRWRVHSMHSHVPTTLEIYPEPVVQMNPDDAASRGIAEGDTVRIFNDRGYVVVKAVMDSGVRPGACVMNHGWDWGQMIEGHYQDLTDNYCKDYACNNNYFDVLCEIEKA